MAWSTSELADLAGTSLRAVRHYHSVGLLAEPERRANGYKDYGVAHLVRLLRIKRLTDLGFSLARIAEMGDLDEHPREALQSMDAELAATIERLQKVRVELDRAVRQEVPADLPPELGPVADTDMSEEGRSVAVVLSRVVGPSGMEVYRKRLEDYRRDDPALTDFDELPADADDRTRSDLVRRLLPYHRAVRAEHPDLQDVYADAPRGEQFAMHTVGLALHDLFNPAQIDVLSRIGRKLEDSPTLEHG